MDAEPKTMRSRFAARWLFVLLGLVVAGVVVRTIGPQTVGEHARREFLDVLKTHYQGLRVSVRRGHYDPRVGLIFEDVQFADPGRKKFGRWGRRMVRIERLIVVTELTPRKLLERQNPLVASRVIVEGLEADAWLDADETLSLQRLWPPPSLGPVCPIVEVRGARINLVDVADRSQPVGIDLNQIQILTQDQPSGRIEQTIQLVGSADFAASIRAEMKQAGGAQQARISVKQARLNDELLNRLPSRWISHARHVRDLDLVCDITAAVAVDGANPADYRIEAKLHTGRIHHDRLPLPLTRVRGALSVTPKGIQIQPSQALLGDALCQFQGQIPDLSRPRDFDLQLRTTGLMLDQRLAAAIPAELRAKWDRFQPQGRIDVDALFSSRRGELIADGSVVCKGVNIRFDRFPYPVDQLVGRIELHDGVASSHSINGRIGGHVVRCAFRAPIARHASAARSIVLESQGGIPIDETLLRALSPRAEPETSLETFVRSLQPSGAVELSSAAFLTDADGTQHRQIELGIVNGQLRYEKFAYPLYNVKGRIRVDDELVQLIDFKATNANAGTIECDGIYQMPGQSPPPNVDRMAAGQPSTASPARLRLAFHAANVSMNDALRSSLPEPARYVWDAVSPSGILDDLRVQVRQVGSAEPLGLDITAIQHDSSQVTNRTLSLRPSAIPFRLDITGGSVHYDGAEVVIKSLRSRHDASHLSADGRCAQDASGRWVLSLDVHGGSRLVPDAELIDALPDEMTEAMRRLQLRGPVSIRGSTAVVLSDTKHPDPTIDWDLLLQLEGNRIGDVGPVHALRGEVSVRGRRDEQTLSADGEVRIDSMHVHDLQIMGIRGPFAIREDKLLLGTTVDRLSQRGREANGAAGVSPRARPIRGQVFGGDLDLQGEVTLSTGEFNVLLAVADAQVTTALADLGQPDTALTGTIHGRANLKGRLASSGLLSGNGVARVTGTNLYKLPLLAQIFNQLRITPTEDVAFTDGDVEFTIDDDQIHFSQLQLWGDLVALHGFGTLNRRHELDLTFNTRVSPQSVVSQVIRPIRGNRYTLWTIDVKGPLESPTIQRRALDGVGETIEGIFSGFTPDFTGDNREHGATPQRERTERGFQSWFR